MTLCRRWIGRSRPPLQEVYGAKCKALFVAGRKLEDGALLRDLGPGSITALAKQGKTAPAPAPAQGPARTAAQATQMAVPSPADAPPPVAQVDRDSLPLIYRTADPVPPSPERPWPGEAVDPDPGGGGGASSGRGPGRGARRRRAEPAPDDKDRGEDSAPAPVGQSLGFASVREMVGRHVVGAEGQGADKLPLPREAQELMESFQALNTIYGFLARQHIQASLYNTRQSAKDLSGGRSLTLEVLRAMAAVAPHVVTLHGIPDIHLTKGRHRGWGGGGGGDATAPAGGFVRVAEEGSLHVDKYGRMDEWHEGAHDALPSAPGDCPNVIIELYDPGRKREASAFSREQHHSLGMIEAGPTVHGRGGEREGRGGGKDPVKQTEKGMQNAASRRQRAFRRALSVATALALEERLERESPGAVGPAPLELLPAIRRGTWPEQVAGSVEATSLSSLVDAVQKETQRVLAVAKTPQSPVSKALKEAKSPVRNPRPPVAARTSAVCGSDETLGPEAWLEHLKGLGWYQGQITHVETVPGRDATLAETEEPLQDATRRALEAKGVSYRGLYEHQATAIDAVLQRRKHVVVATATASGKSLCYNVPALEFLATDPDACCMYMFPTKALAQDQLGALRKLMGDAFGLNGPPVEIYDGDTPKR